MKILTFILGVMPTNCYFLTDEETSETAVVDPAASAETIIKKMKDRNLFLKYIILTHAHFDHMMALEQLRDNMKVPVYVHELDAPAMIYPEQSYMKQFGGVNYVCRPAERLLKDGEILMLGRSEIKIMHTPGHTMGSICILFDSNIITGDTLFRDDIGRYDLYGGDYYQLLQSLKKLAGLEGDFKIFPGHGSTTRLSHERKNNIYLI